MNEHQAGHNLDSHHDYHDSATEQHISAVNPTGNQSQDFLHNPLNTEYSAQQAELYPQDTNQTGYPDTYNNSFNSDLIHQSNLDSNHQNSFYNDNPFTQTVAHNPLENTLQTQDYNNHLWENAFQEHSSSSHNGMNLNQDMSKLESENQHNNNYNNFNEIVKADHSQRSGNMVTINNLSKDHKIGDIISENGKDYKIVDYSPTHGGYDVIPVEHYPDGTYREQGSSNTFLPKADFDLDKLKK